MGQGLGDLDVNSFDFVQADFVRCSIVKLCAAN